MSIHVHHGLIDGLHLGQFVDYFQNWWINNKTIFNFTKTHYHVDPKNIYVSLNKQIQHPLRTSFTNVSFYGLVLGRTERIFEPELWFMFWLFIPTEKHTHAHIRSNMLMNVVFLQKLPFESAKPLQKPSKGNVWRTFNILLQVNGMNSVHHFSGIIHTQLSTMVCSCRTNWRRTAKSIFQNNLNLIGAWQLVLYLFDRDLTTKMALVKPGDINVKINRNTKITYICLSFFQLL
jgi:hypothetical protein